MTTVNEKIAGWVGWKPRDICYQDDQCGNRSREICVKEKCQLYLDYQSWGDTCPDIFEADEDTPDYSHNISLAIEAVEKLGCYWEIKFSFLNEYSARVWAKWSVTQYATGDTPASALCEALVKAKEAK